MVTKWNEHSQRSEICPEQTRASNCDNQGDGTPSHKSKGHITENRNGVINTAIRSLSTGTELSSEEERALRNYKAAVTELQAYSDTELAELGINRDEIFKFALLWQLEYDSVGMDAAA